LYYLITLYNQAGKQTNKRRGKPTNIESKRETNKICQEYYKPTVTIS